MPPGRPLAPFLPLLFCPSLRHPAPSSSQFCTHDILLFGHAPPTRVSASPLPRLPPGSHAATAAPGCALLELARAARPGRGSMSCLRSVPVCVVAIVVVYVKERDTHTHMLLMGRAELQLRVVKRWRWRRRPPASVPVRTAQRSEQNRALRRRAAVLRPWSACVNARLALFWCHFGLIVCVQTVPIPS